MLRTCVTLILLSFLCFSCSSKTDINSATQLSPADRYVESVNSVSGSFSVDGSLSDDKKPFIINLTQAYARVVNNLADQKKKDVWIVLVEKPLTRFALAVAENDDSEEAAHDLSDVLHNRDARGVVFRVALDGQGGDKVRPYFNGNDYDFGNLVLQIKSLSADKVEGQIKSNVSSQQADINFSVKVLPDVWTGGTFYQQPPTNLAPGQASGQVQIDDRRVKFNHAYARLVELDLFDETRNVFRVWLTEKPVNAKLLFDNSADKLLSMKQGGNSVVFTYNTTGPADRGESTLWWVGRLGAETGETDPSGSTGLMDSIPAIERDYARYDNEAIEGRLFSSLPVQEQDRVYKVDLLFNAAILPPAVTDGPVTASNGGGALAADGGAPGKAYLAAIERMKSAKDVDQMLAVWLSVVSAKDAEKLKRDLESVPADKRHVLLELFAPLDDLRLVGGFIKDNRATLRFTGTGRDGKATEVVNMQLEDGQWKISRREIREE